MHALHRHLVHNAGDGGGTVNGEPVDAGPHQKVRSRLLGQAEQFVNVTLAIADANAAPRIAEQFGGSAQVFQPANALLLLNGDPRWVDLPLEGGRSLELRPGPELD